MIYVFILSHIFIKNLAWVLQEILTGLMWLLKEEAKIIDIVNSSPHPRVEFYVVTPTGSNLERLRGYNECEELKPMIVPMGPYAFSNVIDAFKHL